MRVGWKHNSYVDIPSYLRKVNGKERSEKAALLYSGCFWYVLFTTFFPLLVVLQCPSPPNIKNGQHESKDVKVFIPGTSVKYYCDPGYVLTGKTTVSCLTSGTWSIPYPRCEGEPGMLLPVLKRKTITVAQPSLNFDLTKTKGEPPALAAASPAQALLLFTSRDHLHKPQSPEWRGG